MKIFSPVPDGDLRNSGTIDEKADLGFPGWNMCFFFLVEYFFPPGWNMFFLIENSYILLIATEQLNNSPKTQDTKSEAIEVQI